MRARFPFRVAAFCAALVCVPAGSSAAPATEARRIRLASPDEVVEIATAVRHTTVIVLPREERILEFVAGDTESWALEGEVNLAFLKPYAENVRTNVALVTESGRVYSFLCREGGGDPDLVVHVEVGDPEEEEGGRIGSPIHRPAFVAASEVAGYRQAAADAADEADRARRQAAQTIAEQVEAFRSSYPRSMRFEYRLDAKARRDPFHVVALWNDGTHTYLRSTAPESPAIYEQRDGKPSLVEYELTEDGLYVAQRVLRDGWLQVGKQRADWVYVPDGLVAGRLQ